MLRVPVEKLGKPWAVVEPGIGLKQYPCYNGVQRAMYGLLQLRERMGFTAETVERVECRMAPGAMKIMVYPRPVTGLEGKFSMHYALSAGVLDGRYVLSTFTDEAVNRPQIRALLEKIDAREDERCGGNDPLLHTRAAGTRGFVEVTVHLTDGRSETIRIDTVPGHPTRELAWEAIEAKFMDCASHGGVDAGRAAQAFAPSEAARDLRRPLRTSSACLRCAEGMRHSGVRRNPSDVLTMDSGSRPHRGRVRNDDLNAFLRVLRVLRGQLLSSLQIQDQRRPSSPPSSRSSSSCSPPSRRR